MKLLPVLLGASLVTNAALLVVNRSRTDSATGAGKPGLETARSMPGGNTVDARAIAAAMRHEDLELLRDELRAAGLDEVEVRMIVGMRLRGRYESRLNALRWKRDPNQPWWKDSRQPRQTPGQRAELRALHDEIRAEMTRLLGPDPAVAEADSWNTWRYGFLPREKREQLQRIEQDYGDLAGDVRSETLGFMMPADYEKLRFLEEEKLRDLAALLTPEELEELEMRSSTTANGLRWRMTNMDATEEEYRMIFALQREFDERFALYSPLGTRLGARPEVDWAARNEAEKAMREQLKAALGPERYRDYLHARDGDYQQLRSLTNRFELPADTPGKIYNLRDEISQTGQRILNDAALSREEKIAALRRVAADTRERVKDMLGAEVAEGYFANHGMSWLRNLESGLVVTFDEDGGQRSQGIPAAPAKTTPSSR